jgi:insulysin
MDIIKSNQDTRNYHHFTLKNKLECLIIEDPGNFIKLETEKSACSLDVFCGSLDEPEDAPGVAHFLEHMLFMGTKKNPK